jgi:hypothetical protein
MTIYDAIDHAKQEIKSGFALAYHVGNGKLDVLTDQGWSQWYPLKDDSYSGSNDTLGD